MSMSSENRRIAPHTLVSEAVLEHQMPSERSFEQDVRVNNPDVLLEQERRVRAFGLGFAQGEAALFDREMLKLCLTHARDVLSGSAIHRGMTARAAASSSRSS